MADRALLRRIISRWAPFDAVLRLTKPRNLASYDRRRPYSIQREPVNENDKNTTSCRKKDKWFTLPPYVSTVDGAALGKTIARHQLESENNASTVTSASTMTALKWVTRCCPELPRSLVQKLFRLRQVRRDCSVGNVQGRQLKRVSAKELMNSGDRIFLPVTVEKVSTAKPECTFRDEEMKFLHSLIVYKDPAVIVVNKPSGMPVQGGIGIKRSLDELAAEYLRFGGLEAPRLVHRLDRDCSGILVMGRTQLSAAVLHSIFREKTFEASEIDSDSKSRIIQKTYWALVIGSPRCSKGIISEPLGKVVMDNGKSDRIAVIDNVELSLGQYAVTQYEVIGSSCHGYTLLELSPLTGRKHQLRVHCAEVLRTPVVGDYKYGWQAHRNLRHVSSSSLIKDLSKELPMEKLDPFGLNLGNGSIFDKQPRLHLHCKEMILPNISVALQRAQSAEDFDLSDVKSIKLRAPLPSHMQMSWDFLNS